MERYAEVIDSSRMYSCCEEYDQQEYEGIELHVETGALTAAEALELHRQNGVL